MKSLLVTAVITTFVLVLFLHSGNAIVCYSCLHSNCDYKATCPIELDACMIIHYNGESFTSCGKKSECDTNSDSLSLESDNTNSRCCDWDLCNNAPNVVASKIVLCGTLLLTIIPLLKSLVGN